MRNGAAARIAALLCFGVAHGAGASLITTNLPEGAEELTFDRISRNTMTVGPVLFRGSGGSWIRFTAQNSDDSAGFSAYEYGLGTNSIWTNRWNPHIPGYSYAWVNPSSTRKLSKLRFTFLSGPVASVSGFVNYVRGSEPNTGVTPFIIRALSASGEVLEEHLIDTVAPIVTTGVANAGEFRGIVRPSADIHAFELEGASVIRGFTFSAQPMP